MNWQRKSYFTRIFSETERIRVNRFTTDFMWVTWSAFTVRMFPPSSLIGIIAASSHKACRSLPEYPVHVNNKPLAFWLKLRVVKIHFPEGFCSISVIGGKRLGVRILFLAFFRAFPCKPYYRSLTLEFLIANVIYFSAKFNQIYARNKYSLLFDFPFSTRSF